MGPSGSGKTTLINILGGLDTPTSGAAIVDGTNIARLDESGLTRFRAEKVGFVFQQFHLVPYLTALENVMLAQYFHSTTDEAEAREALARVGLAERADHLPAQLSGGEQQRVAVARALINHPKLILADEPTGNLDAANEETVIRLFQRTPRARPHDSHGHARRLHGTPRRPPASSWRTATSRTSSIIQRRRKRALTICSRKSGFATRRESRRISFASRPGRRRIPRTSSRGYALSDCSRSARPASLSRRTAKIAPATSCAAVASPNASLPTPSPSKKPRPTTTPASSSTSSAPNSISASAPSSAIPRLARTAIPFRPAPAASASTPPSTPAKV